ncbi:hypothetical protein ACJX0J_031963, partial [Zea mays]
LHKTFLCLHIVSHLLTATTVIYKDKNNSILGVHLTTYVLQLCVREGSRKRMNFSLLKKEIDNHGFLELPDQPLHPQRTCYEVQIHIYSFLNELRNWEKHFSVRLVFVALLTKIDLTKNCRSIHIQNLHKKVIT